MSTTPIPTLGQKIRELRLARGLTQDELAHGQFSKSYISAVELGGIRPSMRALTMIAERLEVPVSQLLGADARTDDQTDAELAVAAVRYYLLAGDLNQANKFAEQVNEQLLAVGDGHLLRLLRVEIHLALGDTLGAEVLLAHARSKLTNNQDKSVLAYAHYLQARLAWEMGRADVTIAKAKDALSLIRSDEARDIHLEMRVLMLLHKALLDSDPTAALALHREIEALAEIVANAHEMATCYYQSAAAAREQGNPAQAFAALSAAEGVIEWGKRCSGEGISIID